MSRRVTRWAIRLLIVVVTLYGVVAFAQHLLDNVSASKGILPTIGGILVE